MNRRSRFSILLIDAGAGAASAALCGALIWLVLFRGDQTASDVRELRASVDDARRDLAALRSSLDQQQGLLRQRQAELAARGQLPERMPIEEYFQTLSHIASANQLKVVRHNPLSSRSYPGLMEQRYAYEISGAMPDIAKFLKAVEESRFWADVSYLRISGGSRADEADSGIRLASLTISVFSSPRDDPGAAGEGDG